MTNPQGNLYSFQRAAERRNEGDFQETQNLRKNYLACAWNNTLHGTSAPTATTLEEITRSAALQDTFDSLPLSAQSRKSLATSVATLLIRRETDPWIVQNCGAQLIRTLNPLLTAQNENAADDKAEKNTFHPKLGIPVPARMLPLLDDLIADTVTAMYGCEDVTAHLPIDRHYLRAALTHTDFYDTHDIEAAVRLSIHEVARAIPEPTHKKNAHKKGTQEDRELVALSGLTLILKERTIGQPEKNRIGQEALLPALERIYGRKGGRTGNDGYHWGFEIHGVKGGWQKTLFKLEAALCEVIERFEHNEKLGRKNDNIALWPPAWHRHL